MRSGYKVYWTANALDELAKTITYLEENFTDKEIRKLVLQIENTIALISHNPSIFPKSEFKPVYKAIVLKYNTLYYRVNENNIEILSFFSNRQNPAKRNI
ncbi:type II toxin-antitoxin system RelE/ParE family toxin [Sphingobacterium corticibacter]|uniref:Type II toxin-antitoxin system RelE/ParE family toxin n=1 Tax=Sphingobacterium corticibacter TaxID=2171749 RepID=A0A2T8HIW7_9SPHI|nr:type II toxin-antitoxin system RelE/ParE family toxin [Sphingobacterium corticibacter]PVH25389.1 hypothetical protein DC487_10765 [Sphingobacterium corticibacter]